MQAIYFVIGVNGIGKTAVIPILKKKLLGELYTIHDFDERGVPDNADSSWRQSEMKHWIDTAELNKATIICGFLKPQEIQAYLDEHSLKAKIILLDASGDVILERIMSRYKNEDSIQELLRTTGKDPEKFAKDNVWVSDKFREYAYLHNIITIDTTTLIPEFVADKIISALE